MNRTKKTILHGILAVLLIVIDQISKIWVMNNLPGNDIIIWEKVFRLTYVKNTGAAWGMLSNGTLILTIISIIISAAVVILYFKLPYENPKFNVLRTIFVFVVAGAVGNLIDRIRLKFVVDFFYFELIDFPVFNIADCYITVSMFLLAVLLIFYYKDEDFSSLSRNQK